MGGVYATNQAEQMQATVAIFGAVETLEYSLVLMELSFLDRDIYLDNILPYNTTSTDVQMAVRCHNKLKKRKKYSFHDLPNFRVTHQAI